MSYRDRDPLKRGPEVLHFAMVTNVYCSVQRPMHAMNSLGDYFDTHTLY